jgi:hypothetical protein
MARIGCAAAFVKWSHTLFANFIGELSFLICAGSQEEIFFFIFCGHSYFQLIFTCFNNCTHTLQKTKLFVYKDKKSGECLLVSPDFISCIIRIFMLDKTCTEPL